MSKTAYFTSESVSEGHPDKLADQISDAILDAILSQDRHARVACETLVKSGMVILAGEISTSAWVDMEQIARHTILNAGYDNPEYGFCGDSCAVLCAIGKQSADIAQGVDGQRSLGAGDQGLMFGYACDETDVYMPAPITFAHRLVQRQATLRKSGELNWLRPDAKSQITFLYQDGQPVAIDSIVFSTQHAPSIPQSQLIEAVIEEIIKPTIPGDWLSNKTNYHINPTGRFVVGGPVGDCGLTGRKIIVDTYGGMARHGGGAFSGKDPTKVDRSAAYAARHLAKNIVAAGLAKRAEVQLSYAIGVSEPTSINVDTFGTGQIDDDMLARHLCEQFSLSPQGIIERLDLLRPIYQKTAAYGHFGRHDIDVSWESTEDAAALQAACLSTSSTT